MTLQERYEDLVDEFAGVDGVRPPEGGSGFGRGALRYRRKIFAMFVRGQLVVKLLAGFAQYHLRDAEIAFTHTQIDDRFRGQGMASCLVQACLEAARERQLAVLPYCPLVRNWITGHRKYADLVPADRRQQFRL